MYDWPSSTPTRVAGTCLPMAGRATLTIVESRKTIPDPSTTATSVQRLGSIVESLAVAGRGLGAPRDGQPHQLHVGRRLAAIRMAPEHHRPDLAAPDATLPVEGHGQRLARILERRKVREQRSGIHVDGVAADRLYARDPGPDQ